ncbi:MAG: DUF5361 domain-containing protein [Clostridiales bacterium]|nr:DUF5361 domain-containing protein [Clostridiales bacterium]MDY3061130.1 DUF5361 domain-containing protein [Eubacteriales bacterium]
MALSGVKAGPEILLLAVIADNLNLLIWSMSKNGQKNIKRPTSIFTKLAGLDKQSEIMGFTSGEDFINARNVALQKIEKRGELTWQQN